MRWVQSWTTSERSRERNRGSLFSTLHTRSCWTEELLFPLVSIPSSVFVCKRKYYFAYDKGLRFPHKYAQREVCPLSNGFWHGTIFTSYFWFLHISKQTIGDMWLMHIYSYSQYWHMCFFCSGINSIMAQFDIDPYHWPGWMHAALSAAVSTIVLLFFMETRSLSRAKCSTLRCTCLAQLKLSAQLHSKWKVHAVSYCSFIFP